MKRYVIKIANYILRHVLSAKSYAKYSGLSMGRNCIISSKSIGSEPFLITLGNNVHITKGVQFVNHDGGVHVFRGKYRDLDVFGKIIVGDNTYIGNNVIILPGVTIGADCVIGANSVVTKSIEARSVIAGNPARYICSLDTYLGKILNKNASTKGLSGTVRKNKILGLPEHKLIKKEWLKNVKT